MGVHGDKGSSWFEETLIQTWRVSGTPREPSSDRLDPVPDVVPEHEKHKPQIISNWPNWMAESVYAQKTSNKISKNWRYPLYQLLFSLFTRKLGILQISSFTSTIWDIHTWLSSLPLPLITRATYVRFRLIHIQNVLIIVICILFRMPGEASR
jgi:hypothetical protein